MFQDKLSTLIIRCIKNDKFRQTNDFLDLDDFVIKKARTKPFVYWALFSLT